MLCGSWNPLITGFEIIKLVAKLFTLDLSKPTAFAVDLGPYSLAHIISFVGVKDVLCMRKVCRAFFHETKSEHVWLEIYRRLTWMNMSFQLSANMAPVRVYEQGKWVWEDLEKSFRRLYEFREYNSKKGAFRHNYMSFNEFVHCEHKNLWRRRRRMADLQLRRHGRRVAQGEIESISELEAKRRNMLALMSPLMSAYNTVVTSCDARKSTEIAIPKLAIQSFYKLNGIFATSLLSDFRRAIQIGNLVDVLDIEDKVWRVGKVEKSNRADAAERRSIVVSLRGFSGEHNITLNHSDFSKRLFPYRWHTKKIVYPQTTLFNPLLQHVRADQSKKRTFSDFEGTIAILVSNLTFPAVKLIVPYSIGISDVINEYYRITGASYNPHPTLANCNWYVRVNLNGNATVSSDEDDSNTAGRHLSSEVDFTSISNFGNISVENLYNRKFVVKSDNNVLHLLCSLVINSKEICKHKTRLRRRMKPLLKRLRVTVAKILAIRSLLDTYFNVSEASHGTQRNREARIRDRIIRNREARIRQAFRHFLRERARVTSTVDGGGH